MLEETGRNLLSLFRLIYHLTSTHLFILSKYLTALLVSILIYFPQIGFIFSSLYYYPRPGVANCHKAGVLEQQKLTLLKSALLDQNWGVWGAVRPLQAEGGIHSLPLVSGGCQHSLPCGFITLISGFCDFSVGNCPHASYLYEFLHLRTTQIVQDNLPVSKFFNHIFQGLFPNQHL